jgi:filamentous hemagglutinin family protein
MNLKKSITSLLIATFGLMQSAPMGFANPDLDQITHGSGSVSVDGDIYNFQQNSDRLVARFNSFDIAGHETTNILQPSAASAALFRILGQDPSQIFGTLNANGQLFLLNPNGIMFGPTAQVNVGGLVATSLDMKDSDFLAGNYQFDGASAGGLGLVANQGSLTARDGGYLALLGPAVSNSGLMTADGGSVLLGAGNAATLSIDGRGMMNIAVDEATLAGVTDANGLPVKDAAANSGTLRADGGLVKVSAKAVEGAFDNIINHSGIAQARSASVRNGVIVFEGGDSGIVRVSGQADATGLGGGQTGGRVEVTGELVGVANGAVLDASGANGGGAVLVGGDYQGKGVLANAKETIIASGATLKADAVTNGNGGQIVVWSDEATRYYGNLSARGGSEGGDGGFAEVSGKENLLFRGTADLGAPNGASGTLLLDPLNITIRNGSAPPPKDDAQIGDSQILFGDGAATSYEINEGTLEALTANVILQAQQDVLMENLTDNTLNMANLTAGESFTIQAGRDITFASTGDTIVTGGGAIHLEADSPHSTAGAADGSGTLTLGGLNSNGGAITLIGANFALNTAVIAGAGNVAIANSVNASAMALGTAAGAQLTDTELDLIASTGTLTLGQATTKGTDGAGTGSVVLTNGAITLDELTLDAKNVSLISSSTINDDDDAGVSLATTGSLSLTSNGAIGALGGAQGLDLDVDALTVTSTGGNAVTVKNAGTSTMTVDAATGGAGNISITQDANDIAAGAISTTGNVNLTAMAGAITDANAAANNITAAALIASSATGVDLDTTVTNLTATTSGAGNIILNEADGANVLNVAASNGDATVTSTTGDLAVTTVSATGTASLTATAGAITDANAAANNITAASLVASSATGVDLDTTVTNLTATTSGAGNININEADGLNVLAASALNGNTTVTSTTGNINVTTVDAIGGTATLTAFSGAITDANLGVNSVTATNLVASAASGIGTNTNRLETTVSNLEAAGGLGGVFVSNTGGLTIGGITAMNGVTATGSDIKVTASSPLTVNEAVSNTGGGNVVLGALGNAATDDLTVNANVSASGGNGSVTLGAGDSVVLANGTTVSADGTGGVSIVAGEDLTDSETIFNQDGNTGAAGGSILMNPTSNVETEDGDILIDAASSVTVANVNADSDNDNIEGTITVLARAGALLDGNGADVNFTGNKLALTAGGGIGTNADRIETSVNKFEADGGTGGVFVENNKALEIGDASATLTGVTASGSDIKVFAQGPMTVTEAVTNTGGGNIELASKGSSAADDLTLNANVAATGGNGNVLLAAGDTVFVSNGTTVSALGTGAVTVAAGENYTDETLDRDGDADGEVQMGAAGAVTSEDGNILIDARGNAAISTVNANADADGVLGNVIVNAVAGRVTDANGAAMNVTGASLLARGGQGVGTAADLIESTVSNFEADGGTGGVHLINTGALVIGGVDAGVTGVTASGNSIEVYAQSPLTVNETVTNTGGGNITLASLGATGADDLTLNANVAATGGNGSILLVSGDSTIFNAGVTASAVGTGSVTVAAGEDYTDLTLDQDGNIGAGGGSIQMDAASSILSEDGNINLDAADAGSVSVLNAESDVDSSLGNVTIIARAGAITDANGATLNITADKLLLNGQTGVAASADMMETNVNVLEAAGNSGGVFVADQSDLTIGGFTAMTGVSAAGGTIHITSQGAMTVNEAVTNTSNNLIQLSALGNDATRDLTLNANVSSAAGVVVLASGDTTQINNGVTVSVTGAGGGVLVFAGEDAADLVQNQDGNAGGSILMGSNAVIRTDDGDIRLDARNNAQIAVLNADANADATRGNVDITARTGSIIDMNADTLNVTANGLAIQAAAGIAANADRLETSVSNLDASGGSGGVFIRNDRDLAIGGGASALGASLTGVSATGSDIKVTAAGAMTVSENVVNSGGGNIFLHANGTTAGSDLAFNSGADITATGGNGSILLTAGDTAAMGAGSIASVQGAGTVTIAAGEDYSDEVLDQDGSATGDIMMTAGSAVQTQVGNALLDAARDIQVAQVNVNSDANGTIGDVAMLARAGAVTDADGAALNITADDLTIQAASGVAVDGDRLETQVAKFESNAGTGGLFVSNTGNLEIGSASAGFSGLTANGSDVKVTATGSMNVTENVQNTGGGEILLASLGAAASNDVTVNANVTASGGNGNITIAAGDTLDVETNRTINAAGTGRIALLAGENLTDSETAFNQDGNAGGDVNLKVDNILLTESAVRSEDGDILIDARDNVSLTTVNADSDADSTRGDVQIMARAGAITDNNDGISANRMNITADGLHMEAGTGIATNANRLETTANNLEAAGGSGGMFVQNTGALTIGDVTPVNVLTASLSGLTATGSDVKVFATGAMTVNEGVANSGGGNIEMAAQGATAAEDMTINANIAATGGNGNIILAAGDTITQAAATEVSAAGTGAVTMAAGENYADEALDQDGSATGDILQASGATVSSQDGNITMDAARHVNLSLADADRNAAATLGNVRVLARSGAITDSNAASLNVLANTLELQSAQGVAADADRLETTVNNVEATGGTGGVFIQESDALTIGGVTASLSGITASGNAIKITSEGDLTISEGVSQTTSGSDVLLAARGAGANMNVNAAVSAAGGNGNITIAANESVAMNASGSISAAGSGAVNVLAGENLTDSETVFSRDGGAAGDVTMNTASSISSQNGSIRVDAQDSLSLSAVNADSNADAAIGDVALRARTGSITDTNGAALNITAQNLLMQAGTSIATNADRLETSAANLAAAADAGGLFVSNTGALTVTQLTEIAMADGRVITGLSSTAGGDLITTATGAMTVDQAVTAAGGGQVLLASNGTAATNDLNLNANVAATGGNGIITLAAGDTVTFAPGISASAAGTGNVNVLAGENLSDSETVFNQDGNAGGDIVMGLGSAINSQDGNILADARDNAAIDTINANSNADATEGDVTVRARAGAITDVNAAAMNITGRNLSMTAATGIASAADELETAVDRMEAQNGTGGIFTNNTGALEIGNVDGAITGVQNAGGDVRIIGNSSITVNEAMANTGGGNTTITGNGAAAGDSIIINANIANTGGSGSMTLSAGDEILVNGASSVSAAGTGAITATSGTGNAGGDITMAAGSAFRSEDGNIVLTADGDANISEVNADSDADSARGDVTVNANGNGGANGDILDANDAPLVTNNITAATFAATAAGNIGAPADPIEVNAATIGPLTSGGSTNLNLTGADTLLQNANIGGALNLTGIGNLTIENNTVGGGAFMDMGGSILGGSLPSDDMTAQNFFLFARTGILGTPDLPLHLISNGGAISVFAGGELQGNSVNIHSNITRDGLQFMNVPPGLVQVNHGIAGGGNIQSFTKSISGNYELFLTESQSFGSYGQIRPTETQVMPMLNADQSQNTRTMSVPMVETDVVSELEVVLKPITVVDDAEARRKAEEAARLQAAAQAEAARLAAARLEAERLEAARQAAAQAEAARLAAAQAEAARLAAAQAEAARLEAIRLEAARRAAQQVPVQPVTGTTAPTVTPNVQPPAQSQGGFTNLPLRNAFQNLFRPGGLRQVQVEEAPAPAGASDNAVAAEGSSSSNQ